MPNVSFILSPILPSKLCATSPPLKALILFPSHICSLMLYSAHSDVILMRSCRIITAGSKLRETLNGALTLVARSLDRCLYKQCLNELVSRNWKVMSCVWVVSVVWVCLSRWFLWLCPERFLFGMSCVCCLECVFWSLFLGTCFVWWFVLLAVYGVYVYPVWFLLCPKTLLLFCGQMCKSLCLYL